ncbi:MAG TPA: hypothetical protein VM661_10455 [Candidatus Sulfotelmatobacter sp.]|jgi:hypothetical protein|nr:hypothetical protein [Candidatus Sulfotelmatobacter sp.]
MRHSRLATAAVLLLTAAALTGCGKAGRPVSPDPNPHPQNYPQVNAPTQRVAPVEAKPNKDGKAIPPEWDQEDLNNAFTKDGAYIDPSSHRRISTLSSSNFIQQNVSQRTSASGRSGTIDDRNDQSAIEQPTLESRP